MRCERCRGLMLPDPDGDPRCLICGRYRTARPHEEPTRDVEMAGQRRRR